MTNEGTKTTIESEGAKVSLQNAKKAIDLLLDYYDVDLDDLDDTEQRSAVQLAINRVIRAIKKGRLEIKIEGESLIVNQFLANKYQGIESPINYREVDGISKIAMKDVEDSYSRIYAYLGGLSGLGIDSIMKLKGKDLGLVECLGSIFLQV